MQQDRTRGSLETLQEIRSIMERSAKFLSLSGWSGIWAGVTALAGAYIAYQWLTPDLLSYNYMIHPIPDGKQPYCFCCAGLYKSLILAFAIFAIAISGGFYFTWRKVRKQGINIWNNASKQMIKALVIPLFAGAVFCLAFMWHGHAIYIAPACLIFYGLALVNGSKYTHSEIRYLGLLEVSLGSINLFVPAYGFYFWAFGFGVLHVLYGIIMWNKYDKRAVSQHS